MEILRDPEEKIMCPYNSSHHIRRCRMNTHLVKCKKSYPESKLVECDFNVNHKIPEPELQYHHENCPDKKFIEIGFYSEQGVDMNKYPVPNIDVPTEESWDELNVPTYDPKKHSETKEVLRHLDVESAAKRRNFRIAERKRLNQLTGDEKTSSVGPSGPQSSTNKPQLPQPRRTVLEEDTPESITEIMHRIKIGANTSFIPTQKKN